MKNNNEGRLTIISLPIGNLKDITIRALEELESSDLIFCEDTRTTIKLLNHYNIKNKLMSYHEHSDVKTRKFPTPSNIVQIKDEEFENFLNKVG